MSIPNSRNIKSNKTKTRLDNLVKNQGENNETSIPRGTSTTE